MGTKITNLPQVTSPAGTDELAISQDNGSGGRTTYKTTLDQVKNYVKNTGGGTGSVTSVGANSTDGSISVFGSPIVGAGTITLNISSVGLDKLDDGGATNGQVLTYNGSTSTWAAKSGYSVLSKTSNFGITLNEVKSLINVNSNNDIYVTVPSNDSVSIPIGSEILVSQASTGRAIFITNNINVIINSYGSFNSTAGVSSLVRLIKTGTNTWLLNGDIEASVNVNNYEIYNIDNGFTITALIPKIANFDSTSKSIIISALNKWSSILKYTNLPDSTQPNYLYNGMNYITNPLYGERFDGYVLVVNQSAMSPDYDGTLGYAGYTSLAYEPNTTHHLIPRAGYFIINANYINDLMISYTDSNITQLYYTALHELGHAIGIGTTWDLRFDAVSTLNGNSKNVVALERSFVVGAGDTAITPFGSASNIFYTIDRGNNSRGILDTSDAQIRSFTLTGVNAAPGAGFTYAYNTNHPIGNNSKAVYYYNQTFGTNLTAIPLENFGGPGSYGGHWPEGFGNFRVSPITGTDNRTYYGQSIPGAPAMCGELMSPNVNYCDMPISNITLGSLEDLGWSVDYNESDNYEPFKIRAKLTLGSVASANKIYIKQNNFGGWFLTGYHIDNENNVAVVNYTMRRGLNYTILNESSPQTLTVKTSAGNATINTTSQTIDGIPNVTFTVPTNASLNDYIVIRLSSDNNLRIVYKIGG